MLKQFHSKFDNTSTTPIYTTPYLSYTTLTCHIYVTSYTYSYTKTIYFNNGPNANGVT